MKYLKNICKYTVLVFVFSLMVHCKPSGQTAPPANLIDKHLMGRILADVLLLENQVMQTNITSQNIDYQKLQLQNYPLIDEKYHLADSQAYKSYQYYVNNLHEFKEVLEIAQDTLNKIAENTVEPEL